MQKKTMDNGIKCPGFECFEEWNTLLWRRLRESTAGGEAYLFCGERGSGKTELLGELARQARLAQIRVVVSSPKDENMPGEALAVNIIRSLDSGPSGDRGIVEPNTSAESMPDTTGSSTQVYFNGILQANRYTVVRMPQPSPPAELRSKGNLARPSQLTDRLCSALERAASTPILLAVDDLHEADHASIQAITYAARGIGAKRLVIVATCLRAYCPAQTALSSINKFAKLAIHIDLRGARDRRENEPPDQPVRQSFTSFRRSDSSNNTSVRPFVSAEAPFRTRALSSSKSEHLEQRLPSTQAAPAHNFIRNNFIRSTVVRNTVVMRRAEGNYVHEQEFAGFAEASRSSDLASESERCELLIALGERQSRRGEKEAAEKSLREAAALAERAHDAASLTRIVLALPAWHWPGPGEANPLALLLAQRGLVIGREGGGRRAVLMARLGAELSYSPSLQRYSADLVAAAMKEVLDKGGARSELYVRLYRDQVLRGPEHLSERLANTEEVQRLAIEAGDYGACYVAALAKSSALKTCGDMSGAEHADKFAMGIAPTSQVRFHEKLSVAYRAYRAVTDGRFGDAAEEFRHCRLVAEEYNLPYLIDACWPSMLMPYREQRRLVELESAAEDTVRRRPSVLVYSAFLSWLKMQTGCLADASFLLERLAADEFADLAKSAEGLVGMAVLAEVCSGLNRPDFAGILYERLLPFAGLNATLNAFVFLGSIERYVGILASLLGRADAAVKHFEESLRLDRKNGARPWAVYSGLALATGLARRGTPEDRTRALGLLDSLRSEAAGLNMSSVLSKLSETSKLLTEGEVTVAERFENPTALIVEPLIREAGDCASRDEDSAAVQNGEVDSARNNRSECGPPANGRIALFCRNGDYWQVGYEGRTCLISHRRGLSLLSVLLQHPEREFFALELAHEGKVHPGAGGHEDGRSAESADGPVLDAEAKRSYRERLREIRSELEELHGDNDINRMAKLQEEQDFLTRELASAIGLFGRDRKFGSEGERARKSVGIAIARAIRLISVHDKHFGRYLERSIRTGNLCRYMPDPEHRIKCKL